MSRSKRPPLFLLFPLLILLVPFTAMQISEKVNWSSMDFLIAGMVILLTSFGAYYLPQLFKNSKIKIVIGLIIIAAALLFWAELAVGIF